MNKLQFKVSINVTANKIYYFIISIKNQSIYEQWSFLFSHTSNYEGSCDQGNIKLSILLDEKREK